MLSRRELLGLSVSVVPLLIVPSRGYALALASLSWGYDVAWEPSISGYRLYWGKTSHAGVSDPVDEVSAMPYDNMIELVDPSLRSYDLVVGHGRYYFRMTAYSGVSDSVFSNEATGYIDLWAPDNLAVQP